MTSCFLGFLTIVLIETVAGKCLGSRGKKSQEEENEQRDRMKEAELALEGELYHNELEMYL